MTHSIDQTLHQFANLLPNWTLLPILTLLPNFGGFHRTLQRVRLANRGRLLLRTTGPVPLILGLAFVLMLRPFFPELVMSTDLLSLEHPSVLLFCLSLNTLQIKFECLRFASIFVGVLPLSELSIHSFPHLSPACFDILRQIAFL